ncbi:MAG: hypothetical protein ABH869_07695 [Candidatus Omnitrophota bacterium]
MKIIFNNKGISFIEVMVSAVLVALGTTALISAVMQSSVFSKNVDTAYTSSYIAERRLEVLRSIDFDLLSETAETEARVAADGTIDSAGEYFRTTGIETGYDSNVHLVRAKITVKRVKTGMDGSLLKGAGGQLELAAQPVIMETLFSDVDHNAGSGIVEE